jgi:hypothetical protein
MVRLKNNEEYIGYIRMKMHSTIRDMVEIDTVYEGEPNNNFQIDFYHLDDRISIIKDRGYLGLEIKRNSKNIEINFLDERINNMYLSVESIDYYIDFLKRFYEDKEKNSTRGGILH